MDADELASGGAAPAMLLVLPGLVAFAVAVGASRLLPAVGRLAARRGRGEAPASQASRSLARPARPGSPRRSSRSRWRSQASRRRTGRRSQTGERDQAAFAVPTDVVVREDLRSLVPVLRAAPLERYAAIPASRQSIRWRGSPRAPGPRPRSPASPCSACLPRHSARSRSGGTTGAPRATPSPSAVERDGPTQLRGPILSRLRARSRGRSRRCCRSARSSSSATAGSGHSTSARRTPTGPRVLRARLPRDAQGARLVALELVAPRLVDRGADAGIALRGATALRVAGVSLDGWIGEGGVTPAGRSTRARHAGDVRRHRSAPGPRPPAAADATTIRRPPS